MALSANSPMKEMAGNVEELPVKASTTIYEGAMVGDDASGYARGLVAGDPFRGHAIEKVVCGTTAGAEKVKVLTGRYRLKVAVTGASAVTDVGASVYASADGTCTLTKGSNTPVGRVVEWVTSTTCIVEFSAAQPVAHGHTGVTDGGALASPMITTTIKNGYGTAVINISNSTSVRLLGLFGATPVSKPAALTSLAASFTSASALVKINGLITRLRAVGLITA